MNDPYNRLLGSIAVIGFAALAVDAHASAPAGRYTVNGGTVLDKQTKLTWQRTPSTTKYSWADAKTACAAAGATLGGSGWRVPTIKELHTLIDYSQPATAAAIDPAAFPETPMDNFWSSTPLSGSTSMAWNLSFVLGNPSSASITSTLYVRCIR